ncbi:cellulose binding domain-containing protein [Lentzea sp. NPDC004789]
MPRGARKFRATYMTAAPYCCRTAAGSSSTGWPRSRTHRTTPRSAPPRPPRRGQAWTSGAHRAWATRRAPALRLLRPRPRRRAPAPTYGCTVTYRVAKRWQGGFHAEITIANTGNTDIVRWTLHWAFARGETVTETWNTMIEQSGADVKASDVAASATIRAGSSQWLRFNATQSQESPARRRSR